MQNSINKQAHLGKVVFICAVLYITKLTITEIFLFESTYLTKNFVPDISLIKYDKITSLIWLEVLKGIMRLIVLLFFLSLINKFHEKYAFNTNRLIKFLGVIFILFNVILIFLLTNLYVFYFYLFHTELRDNLDINMFTFWLSNFLNLLNLKDVLFMVFTNNFFPILILYTFFLKFLNHKNYIAITNGNIDKLDKIRIKQSFSKEQVNQNKVKQIEKVIADEINYNDLDKKGSQASIIVLNKLGIDHFVNLADIIVIEANGNYINIITDEDSYLARSSSKQMLSTLPDYFLRIHRSTIVNTQKVIDVRVATKSRNLKMDVKLTNGKWYAVSKTYQNIIQPYLNNITDQH